MKNIAFLLISTILLTTISCNDSKESKSTKAEESHRLDAHSYANMDEIKTKHLHLDLTIDFSKEIVYGIARHTMENMGTDTAVFDIKALDIQKVTVGPKDNEKETDYVIGQSDPILGEPLMVKIDSTTTQINIYYQTTDECEAIDWLPKELTSGKQHPYMYTQGQAILTRTWIPCQDSPANRITYTADVSVPSELLAIMSAENPIEKNETGKYHFTMHQAIPAYLIAIAVGDMEYIKLGKNSGVYAEPELVKDAASEFKDLPKMITAAENLYGPYRWEQYDVVVLPYSFPFGGMENPRLTFANPTLIAGDRSLVSVIAHELAHSWSGNLVTNSSWDDFWLNEGFTVYFENRIMEELYGKEVADILAVIEFQELQNTLDRFEDHPYDTKLKLNLKDRNPDDGMTDIAYVKGAYFLRTIEQKVGRDKFDSFLRNYFDHHAFKTISTEDFISYLENDLLAPNKISMNVDEWVYEAGLPSNCIAINSDRLTKIQSLAKEFGEGKDIFKGKRIKRKDYVTQEWQAFIRALPKQMDTNQMILLDKHLNFKGCGNSEIMCEWYVLGIQSGYKSIRPEMEAFLGKIGRRKYLEPIYMALKASKDSSDLNWAKGVFEKVKDNYHYVSMITIAEILE